MSDVTNIILHLKGEFDPHKTVVKFNEHIHKAGGVHTSFGSFDFERDDDQPYSHTPWYGGSKYLEAELYCGSLNFLDLDQFIKFIKSLEWPDNSIIQLMVKEQEDDMFKLINVVNKGTEPAI